MLQAGKNGDGINNMLDFVFDINKSQVQETNS